MSYCHLGKTDSYWSEHVLLRKMCILSHLPLSHSDDRCYWTMNSDMVLSMLLPSLRMSVCSLIMKSMVLLSGIVCIERATSTRPQSQGLSWGGSRSDYEPAAMRQYPNLIYMTTYLLLTVPAQIPSRGATENGAAGETGQVSTTGKEVKIPTPSYPLSRLLDWARLEDMFVKPKRPVSLRLVATKHRDARPR
jgi:hypothetical protein